MIKNKEQYVLGITEFDTKIRSDPTFRESIAGFSCMSLSHLKKGRRKRGFSVPLFSENRFVYIDLHRDVYREVFKAEPQNLPTQDNELTELLYLIDSNRGYAKAAGMKEFLSQQPRVQRWRHIARWELGEYLGKKTQYFNNYYFWYEGQYSSKGEELAARLFPDDKTLADAIIEIRKRNGIQVVYGDKDILVEFLKRNNPIPADECAVKLTKKIPASIVLAVVPLGQYEEDELLNLANVANQPIS